MLLMQVSQGVTQDGGNNPSSTHWKTRRMIRYEILQMTRANHLENNECLLWGEDLDSSHPGGWVCGGCPSLSYSLALIWKPGQVGKPLSASLWMVNIEQRTTKINKASSTQWTLSRDRNILLYFSLLSHLRNHPNVKGQCNRDFSDARNKIHLVSNNHVGSQKPCLSDPPTLVWISFLPQTINHQEVS